MVFTDDGLSPVGNVEMIVQVCLFLISYSVLLDMAMRAYVYYHGYCISNKNQRYFILPPNFNKLVNK